MADISDKSVVVDTALKEQSIDAGRDVLENEIYCRDVETLRLLLKDHSTGRNIRWATKDYVRCGVKGFGEWDSISVQSIIRKNGFVIQPRVDKSEEEQRARSVEKAEVFTPSWVCNKQNNLVDAAWFGRKNAGFNREIDTGDVRWKTIEKPIVFGRKKTWQDYVRALRLEVTCGEAPYLTCRYDTVSGIYVQPNDRIGLLDRKLRVISENVSTEADWEIWALTALRCIYGFEYQGDSLLIARENLLYAVREYYQFRFGRDPSVAYERQCAEIISWNVWQMDGLKYVVPGTCRNVSEPQLNLFACDTEVKPCPGCKSNDPQKHNGTRCRIMDWETGSQVLFVPPFKFEPIDDQRRHE